MKGKYGGITAKKANCPSCNSYVKYREKMGIKRPVPRLKKCSECGEIFR